MSAVRTLALCGTPSYEDHLRRARISGEARERKRVIEYLLSLENDDAYGWESPLVLADRLLCGIHHEGRKK